MGLIKGERGGAKKVKISRHAVREKRRWIELRFLSGRKKGSKKVEKRTCGVKRAKAGAHYPPKFLEKKGTFDTRLDKKGLFGEGKSRWKKKNRETAMPDEGVSQTLKKGRVGFVKKSWSEMAKGSRKKLVAG